jgi:uncharacterized protein (DUF1684 family)
MAPEYVADLLQWRSQKEHDLRRRDGWLALTGLDWLSEGRHTVGSDAAAAVRLPAAYPPRLGEFEVADGAVYFRASTSDSIDGLPSDGMPLRPDTSDDPTFLRLGDLTMVVIDRSGRLGVRVWDNARLTSSHLPSRSWFDPDPRFVLEAEFVPAPVGGTVRVPDETGAVREVTLVGTAHFVVEGIPASLAAIPTEDGRLWFLFNDLTNGTTTYSAGRFLVAGPIDGGRVGLDFNRAYNPPCAFTRYATCPLPPRGNRLDVSIEAGEAYRHAA